ncbi:hypothetical protein QEW_4437 [Clostridioides difficile CD160]|nr:hypothetical protein QEW_4437 [Clostridioides difficile CD160]
MLSYMCVDSNRIEKVIYSDAIKDFKAEVIKYLEIRDYSFSCECFSHDESGYINQNVNASFFPKENKIVFYTEAMANHISNSFKVFENNKNKILYDDVVLIFIKLALVHELVHAKQFESRRLTTEINEKMKSTIYVNRWAEIEANKIAIDFVSNNTNNFGKNIVKYLNSRSEFTNFERVSIMEEKEFSDLAACLDNL